MYLLGGPSFILESVAVKLTCKPVAVGIVSGSALGRGVISPTARCTEGGPILGTMVGAGPRCGAASDEAVRGWPGRAKPTGGVSDEAVLGGAFPGRIKPAVGTARFGCTLGGCC